MAKLIHPELSYQVRGVLLDVYNTLGPLLKESYYRDAIGIGLQQRGLVCEVEKGFEVYYQEERVGLYYVDVWIEGGKILLELKVASQIAALHKAQTISYLKVTDADLAILANYGAASLEDHRLPNFLREQPEEEFAWQPQPYTTDLLYPDLINAIHRACYVVHFTLGTGFLSQIYRRAARIELRRSGLSYEYLTQLPIEYNGHLLGSQEVRLILVEGKILLATFALQQIEQALVEKLKAHLCRLQLKLGILANFYGTKPTIQLVRVP